MILKQLVERYEFDIVSFIFKIYKKLNLSLDKALVLMNIFNLIQNRKTVSIGTISKGLDFDTNVLSQILDDLIEEHWIVTSLEVTKGGKQKEVYNLDPTYEKIETFLTDLEEPNKEDVKDIALTIGYLEKALNRMLKSHEIEMVRNWYERKLVTSLEVHKIISNAPTKITVVYVDRFINQQQNSTKKTNPKVESAINQLFNKKA